MTFFLILAAVVVLAELAAGFRWLRDDRPSAPPRSHRDWSPGSLPSTPYATR